MGVEEGTYAPKPDPHLINPLYRLCLEADRHTERLGKILTPRQSFKPDVLRLSWVPTRQRFLPVRYNLPHVYCNRSCLQSGIHLQATFVRVIELRGISPRPNRTSPTLYPVAPATGSMKRPT